jgi:hypothetical protein
MGEQSDFVEVGEVQYRVVKTGRAQAEQVLLITKWITRYGMPAIQEMQKEKSGTLEFNSGLDFISGVLDHLTADALIDLFQALVGCPKEDAEVYFDISILIDVLIRVYNENTAIQRVLERFFSIQDSTPSTEDISTPSGAPTDTATT